MSETSLSFLPDEPADEIGDDGRPASRTKVLAGGAALLLALALGGWTLLGSGSEADDLALGVPPAPVAPGPQPTPTASATPTPSPSAAPATAGRDPFAPQVAVVAPVAGGAAALPSPSSESSDGDPGEAAGGTGGTGGTDAEHDGGVLLPLLPGSDGTAGGTGAGPGGELPSTPPATGTVSQRLSLARVTGSVEARSAVFTVDGVAVTVAVGDSFGPSSPLVLVSVQEGPEDGQWTAVVRAGEREPFDVVTGTPVTVL